jgi:hypothetical protein
MATLGIFGIKNKPSSRKCLKRIPKQIEFSPDYFSEFALSPFAHCVNLVANGHEQVGSLDRASLRNSSHKSAVSFKVKVILLVGIAQAINMFTASTNYP